MSEPSPPDSLRVPNDGHVPWLLRRIWDRVNTQDEHFMGVIVGQEGSGKSHTAIRIASEIDPSFTADRVIFDVADLLEALGEGEHEPGDFYVLDEAGVQLGRRTWQQRGQVLANQALQLIRNHNLGLIFTLPRLSELDTQTQGRLQAFFELIEKEPGEFVRGKWKWLDPDRADRTGKIYRKYPRRRVDSQLLRVTSLAFRPPDAALIEPYEERKAEFQQQFYEETVAELRDETDEEDDQEDLGPKEVAERIKADDRLEDVLSFHEGHRRWYVDAGLVRAEFDLSHADAKTTKELLKRDPEVDIEETGAQREATA